MAAAAFAGGGRHLSHTRSAVRRRRRFSLFGTSYQPYLELEIAGSAPGFETSLLEQVVKVAGSGDLPLSPKYRAAWALAIRTTAQELQTRGSLALSEDPPPERIVIATAGAREAYHAHGLELAELIREQSGPEVAVETSGGSVTICGAWQTAERTSPSCSLAWRPLRSLPWT